MNTNIQQKAYIAEREEEEKLGLSHETNAVLSRRPPFYTPNKLTPDPTLVIVWQFLKLFAKLFGRFPPSPTMATQSTTSKSDDVLQGKDCKD